MSSKVSIKGCGDVGGVVKSSNGSRVFVHGDGELGVCDGVVGGVVATRVLVVGGVVGS